MATDLNDAEIMLITEGLNSVLPFAKNELAKKIPSSSGYNTVQNNVSFCLSAAKRLAEFQKHKATSIVLNEGELQMMLGGLDYMLSESEDFLKTLSIIDVDYVSSINAVELMKTTKEKIIALMAAHGFKPR